MDVVNEEAQLLQDANPEDKLLNMLPKSLLKYVKEPNLKLQDVVQGKGGGFTPLACLLCPYAFCNMVLVPQGNVALTWYGDTPLVYGPGRHFLLAPTHSVSRIVELVDNPVIKHGSVNIISVQLGQVGLAHDVATGLPMIMSTGTHIIDSETFSFNEFSQLTNRVTEIGTLRLIRVELGDVGYGYRSDGELMILKPGLHLVTPPDRYMGTLSMQVQILRLPDEVHESKDYVQIAVRAAVYYKIRDPHLALREVGTEISKQIKDLAVAALQQIIRSSTLVDIAGTSKISYSEEVKQQKETGEADFYAKIHDEFMSNLHDTILEQWGIDISNIRIESLRIQDKKLAASIANQAIQVSELEARHMMLEKQTDIITVEANNKAKELEIQTEAEAYAMKRKAEAEAESLLIHARSQKDAKVLQGEGEKEYATLVKESGLGAELALLDVHAQAMKGMKQVCYVPHLPSMLGKANPLMDSGMMLPGGV